MSPLHDILQATAKVHAPTILVGITLKTQETGYHPSKSIIDFAINLGGATTQEAEACLAGLRQAVRMVEERVAQKLSTTPADLAARVDVVDARGRLVSGTIVSREGSTSVDLSSLQSEAESMAARHKPALVLAATAAELSSRAAAAWSFEGYPQDQIIAIVASVNVNVDPVCAFAAQELKWPVEKVYEKIGRRKP